MVFLLDSNAFSDLMRKNPRVEARLAALDPNDQVVICSIVRGEILYGLERLPQGRRRDDLAKQAAPLFALRPAQVRPIQPNDVAHVRELAATGS
jgi:predicted nucleic acid-binding protein